MGDKNSAKAGGIGFWGFGSALAMVISWPQNASIFWAIVHGLLSWLYVVYYALTG